MDTPKKKLEDFVYIPLRDGINSSEINPRHYADRFRKSSIISKEEKPGDSTLVKGAKIGGKLR